MFERKSNFHNFMQGFPKKPACLSIVANKETVSGKTLYVGKCLQISTENACRLCSSVTGNLRKLLFTTPEQLACNDNTDLNYWL